MLAPGAALEIDVDAAFEHGVLVDTGLVGIADSADGAASETKPGELAYVAPGRERLRLTAYDEARVLLLGGEPLGESIVMWWNFVGRTHEEIVAFREEWQAQIEGAGTGQEVRPGRSASSSGSTCPRSRRRPCRTRGSRKDADLDGAPDRSTVGEEEVDMRASVGDRLVVEGRSGTPAAKVRSSRCAGRTARRRTS